MVFVESRRFIFFTRIMKVGQVGGVEEDPRWGWAVGVTLRYSSIQPCQVSPCVFTSPQDPCSSSKTF